MDAFDLDRALIRDYERFARSFTQIRAEDIRSKVGAFYESRRFWSEPLIGIDLRFERGSGIEELVADGTLHPDMVCVFRVGEQAITLYRHQVQAVGKSLCFFIPIIGATIKAHAAGEERRTRTIIGCPMNTLADSQMMKRVGNFEWLHRICPANMVKGRKEDEGYAYSYLPQIDVSVQDQDANGACRAVMTAAQVLGMSLDTGFTWRVKETAACPGERARVRILPQAGTPTGRRTAA